MTAMAKRNRSRSLRRRNEAMAPGTKLALTITVVAIVTGLTIKVVRAATK